MIKHNPPYVFIARDAILDTRLTEADRRVLFALRHNAGNARYGSGTYHLAKGS